MIYKRNLYLHAKDYRISIFVKKRKGTLLVNNVCSLTNYLGKREDNRTLSEINVNVIYATLMTGGMTIIVFFNYAAVKETLI